MTWQKKKKLKSFSLSEAKRKLPHVWVQLCFQMCQGSGVKDKSTRMWRTPTRTWSAVCAFLTGGGQWAECLVFLLSSAPSEWPHFAVVSYDTMSFVLNYFGNVYRWHRGKMSAVLKIAGGKQAGRLLFRSWRRSRGLRFASDLLHGEHLKVLKYSVFLSRASEII